MVSHLSWPVVIQLDDPPLFESLSYILLRGHMSRIQASLKKWFTNLQTPPRYYVEAEFYNQFDRIVKVYEHAFGCYTRGTSSGALSGQSSEWSAMVEHDVSSHLSPVHNLACQLDAHYTLLGKRGDEFAERVFKTIDHSSRNGCILLSYLSQRIKNVGLLTKFAQRITTPNGLYMPSMDQNMQFSKSFASRVPVSAPSPTEKERLLNSITHEVCRRGIPGWTLGSVWNDEVFMLALLERINQVYAPPRVSRSESIPKALKEIEMYDVIVWNIATRPGCTEKVWMALLQRHGVLYLYCPSQFLWCDTRLFRQAMVSCGFILSYLTHQQWLDEEVEKDLIREVVKLPQLENPISHYGGRFRNDRALMEEILLPTKGYSVCMIENLTSQDRELVLKSVRLSGSNLLRLPSRFLFDTELVMEGISTYPALFEHLPAEERSRHLESALRLNPMYMSLYLEMGLRDWEVVANVIKQCDEQFECLPTDLRDSEPFLAYLLSCGCTVTHRLGAEWFQDEAKLHLILRHLASLSYENDYYAIWDGVKKIGEHISSPEVYDDLIPLYPNLLPSFATCMSDSVVERVLSGNPHLITCMSEYFLKNEDFVWEFEYPSHLLITDEVKALEVSVEDYRLFAACSKELRDNKSLVSQIILHQPCVIQYASRQIRNDTEVALLLARHGADYGRDIRFYMGSEMEVYVEYVSNLRVASYHSFMDIPEHLLREKDFMKACLSRNIDTYRFFKRDLLVEYGFLDWVLERVTDCFDYIELNQRISDKQLVLRAISGRRTNKQVQRFMRNVNRSVLMDRSFALSLVRTRGITLGWVSESYIDRELVMEALKQDSAACFYVHVEYFREGAPVDQTLNNNQRGNFSDFLSIAAHSPVTHHFIGGLGTDPYDALERECGLLSGVPCSLSEPRLHHEYPGIYEIIKKRHTQ